MFSKHSKKRVKVLIDYCVFDMMSVSGGRHKRTVMHAEVSGLSFQCGLLGLNSGCQAHMRPVNCQSAL